MTFLGPKLIGNFKKPTSRRRGRGRSGNSKAHLITVRKLPSCLSGRTPCVVHHLLGITEERGVGQRATDRWVVPLTWGEHDKFHSEAASRTEGQWFQDHGIGNVYKLAFDLWNAEDEDEMRRLLFAHRGWG